MPRGQCKKTCSKCKRPLELTRVDKQRYCRSCHAEHMRRTRPKHSELTDEARKKANARSYLKEYIKRGKVEKKPCEKCGDSIAEAHHEDYDSPLKVIWLCRGHHLELHKNKI